MDALFVTRDMQKDDLPLVNALGGSEGFGQVQPDDAVRVAVNEDGEIVGFLRLAFGEQGEAHVNPVVVYETWRRFGVGRTLLNEALRTYKELRLVARGWTIPFYEALGFEPCNWEDISKTVAAECDGCEMRGGCHPQPMSMRL